jgi:hypothetical protein
LVREVINKIGPVAATNNHRATGYPEGITKMHDHNSIDWQKLQEAVAELAAEHPDLAPEIERGAQLVALGAVTQTGCNAWQIHDPAMQEICTVLFALDWSCTCGAQDGVATWHWWLAGWQPVCQHIAAAGLHWLASTHDESAPMQPAREFDPGDAYRDVNAVVLDHVERGDVQHLGGLYWAAGWLAAEARRRDVA